MASSEPLFLSETAYFALKKIQLFIKISPRPPAYQGSQPRPKQHTHAPDGDPINQKEMTLEAKQKVTHFKKRSILRFELHAVKKKNVKSKKIHINQFSFTSPLISVGIKKRKENVSTTK